jgi:hypothetical protein
MGVKHVFRPEQSKIEQPRTEMEAVENLNNAVIEQAVADMAYAVMKKELAERAIFEAEKVFVECTNFFNGAQIKNTTSVPGKILLDAAIQQGHYLTWKHDRGCAKCKYGRNRKCRHGQGGVANWNEWSKGGRTCLLTNKKQKPDLSEMPDVY